MRNPTLPPNYINCITPLTDKEEEEEEEPRVWLPHPVRCNNSTPNNPVLPPITTISEGVAAVSSAAEEEEEEDTTTSTSSRYKPTEEPEQGKY